MANTKSAQKAQRQAERRAARNQPVRSAIRTFVKKASAAIAVGEEQAATAVREAVSALDKAAKKGVIHRNAASRRKSRLMARLHALSLPETTVEAPAKKATKAPAASQASAAKPRTAAKKPAAPAAAKKTTTAARTTRAKAAPKA